MLLFRVETDRPMIPADAGATEARPSQVRPTTISGVPSSLAYRPGRFPSRDPPAAVDRLARFLTDFGAPIDEATKHCEGAPHHDHDEPAHERHTDRCLGTRS
jgi:hypothetical protein